VQQNDANNTGQQVVVLTEKYKRLPLPALKDLAYKGDANAQAELIRRVEAEEWDRP
jgi:hypothetical protein